MNILFLSHRIPFPPNKGDKIRSFNEIKYLSRNHDIYLCTTLDQQSDVEYIDGLRPYCKEVFANYFRKGFKLFKNIFCTLPFSVANFYDASLQRHVDRLLKEKTIDVIFCFCSSMAEYVFKSPQYVSNEHRSIKLIMDYVDLDSDKWLQYSKYRKFPMSYFYKIESRRLFKYEVMINQNFDASIFVSKRELDIFKALYPEAKNITVVPNGVDSEFFEPSEHGLDDEGVTLVFTGVMDYFANEDGVNWFCKNIYPAIKKEVPETKLYIVGNRPTKRVKNLSKIEGIEVTGYVESIRKYYWMADVCVVPLRIARGLQNKVLEAMSIGNPVVATSNATDGIIVHDGVDIVIADDEDKFTNEVLSLIRNKDRSKKMGERATQNMRKNYQWNIHLEILEKMLSKL